MTLLNILIRVIVLGLLYWLVMQLPIPAPFRTVVHVVFIIVCILILLSFLGIGGVSMPSFYRG